MITKKIKKRKIEKEYSDSPVNMKQSSGSKSESLNYNISSENDSNNNYINNKIVENSNETPSRNKSNNSYEDTDEKYNISSSETEQNEMSEEESETIGKGSQKKRISVNSNEINSRNEEESQEEESEEEEKVEKPKAKKVKRNLKEQLEKFKYEENLKVLIKFSKLLQVKMIKEIKNILKTLLIFQKIRNYRNNCATKISNTFKTFIARQNFKFDYLIQKILLKREEYALKISSFYKTFVARIQAKQLLKKAKNNHVIYSSLINNKILYFKYKMEENLHFEYSPLLKSFVLFINKPEKMTKKLIEGYFYNENYNKLIDPIYETNNKGENVINFQEIFKKADLVNEKNERILKRYIKLHKPIKRERIDDYEERKRKAYDDDNLSRSQTIKKKISGNNLRELSRSKSFYKLKPKKGILKPSKSYINLRCEEKKIHFGNARIKKYHNTKK